MGDRGLSPISAVPDLRPISPISPRSRHINHRIANRKLPVWQAGYGVVSFGAKDPPWVADYIRNQKQHHARGATHDRLERVERTEEAR